MDNIELISSLNAELFIKKHFNQIPDDDPMVQAMRKSVRETIRKSLLLYDNEVRNKRKSRKPEMAFAE